MAAPQKDTREHVEALDTYYARMGSEVHRGVLELRFSVLADFVSGFSATSLQVLGASSRVLGCDAHDKNDDQRGNRDSAESRSTTTSVINFT